MYSVLLVANEDEMLNGLHSLLIEEEMGCIRAASENEVIHTIQHELIDLLILDPSSLSTSWMETCRKVKDLSPIPILILTESADKQSVLNGFHAGVDDFMTKPIDEDIFLAKIKANLRREGLKVKGSSEIHFKGLVLNRDLYIVKYGEATLSLTQKEFALLDFFLMNQNQVLTRENLISQIWGYKYTDARTVDSHIRNLRGKLRKVKFPIDDYLRTAWGYGYKWVTE